jgi:hypothetical protein
MTIYADYTGRLTPEELKAAGVTGVCRYLSWLPNSKCILKAEYDDLVSGGIDVILNWEYYATDWLGGRSAGAVHANEAVRQARNIGYPMGKPIPGSCDFNINRSQWDSTAKAYAESYSSGIRAGGYVPGVYGPWNVLEWCANEIPGFGFFWQAGMSWAWENNNQDWSKANLIQRRHLSIAGEDTDVSDKVKGWKIMSDWGNLPAPKNFGYPADVASVDTWAVLRNGAKTGWSDTDGRGWWIYSILTAILQNTTNPAVSVTMSADDRNAIVEELKATLINDIADAVFTRLKDQMDK